MRRILDAIGGAFVPEFIGGAIGGWFRVAIGGASFGAVVGAIYGVIIGASKDK